MGKFSLALKVLIDSNLFLLSIKKRFDIYREIEEIISRRVQFIIIPQVNLELKKIASQKRLLSKDATLALKLAERCEIIDFSFLRGEDTDGALLRASKEHSVVVATADVKMRRTLRDNYLPVISLRGRRFYCEPEDPELWFLSKI